MKDGEFAGLFLAVAIAAFSLGMLITTMFAFHRYNPCDVNRDGNVTLTDLVIVKRMILEGMR